MKHLRKALFLVLAVLLVLPQVAGATTSTTEAHPAGQPSSWAVEQVNRAISMGLVPQALQSQYTQATTRAEFTALAVALYETVTGREITERMTFNDTTDINVQKMGGLGVVSGVGGGNFAPDDALTREQAGVMLAGLAYAIGQPLPDSQADFADNALISPWAMESVGQMQTAGIMGGVGNNMFAPSDPYTREQSIVTILRLFDILQPVSTTPIAQDTLMPEERDFVFILNGREVDVTVEFDEWYWIWLHIDAPWENHLNGRIFLGEIRSNFSDYNFSHNGLSINAVEFIELIDSKSRTNALTGVFAMNREQRISVVLYERTFFYTGRIKSNDSNSLQSC